MDKEKAKALSKTLACYKELQENNSVNLIEFHTADGQKHGIGNPEAIKLLLSVAVIELERQLRTAQFGDIPERKPGEQPRVQGGQTAGIRHERFGIQVRTFRPGSSLFPQDTGTDILQNGKGLSLIHI